MRCDVARSAERRRLSPAGGGAVTAETSAKINTAAHRGLHWKRRAAQQAYCNEVLSCCQTARLLGVTCISHATT